MESLQSLVLLCARVEGVVDELKRLINLTSYVLTTRGSNHEGTHVEHNETFDINVDVDLDFANFLDDEVQPHNPVDVASPSFFAPTEIASSQFESTTSTN
ncbi:hypothetical protein V6N13_103395 [Hibiscus sabdariffa]